MIQKNPNAFHGTTFHSLVEDKDRKQYYQHYIKIVKNLAEDLIKELENNITKMSIHTNPKVRTDIEKNYFLLGELIENNDIHARRSRNHLFGVKSVQQEKVPNKKK